jgi:DNA topoisomerase-2
VDKRKSHLIEKMNKDILLNASRYLFIKNVTEGNIVVNKQKKEAIIEQLDKPEFDKIIKDEDSYDYLLRMPIYNLTEERMEELKNKIIDMKKELTIIKETSAADMWSKEIAEIC